MAKTYKVTNEQASNLLELAKQVQDQTGDWRAAADDLVAELQELADITTEPERVIFRKFPHDGAIIALFPDQYNERNGNIGSYMELGQHAETAPDFGDTKPADDHEWINLYKELQRQGYTKLKVVKRFGKLGRK